MDKTAIKNYAVSARKKLMEAVRLKAEQYGIVENNGATSPDDIFARLQETEMFLSSGQKRAVHRLFLQLQREGYPQNKAAFNRIIEDVAYTWFNRIIALRFMEVNGYLPANIRILSSHEEGRLEPDALRDADRLDYVNQSIIAELSLETTPAASEKLYKYILISQCNALSKILPGMFQQIDDYTELLLPDALYHKGGIVHDLVNAIPEDNFKNSVQIIGWLYQFYISEKKDEVFAALKKNVKINKDTIPAATQLFTPEWIVKYMVENSLGRLWLERYPSEDLRAKWKYYIDEAEQEPEVAARLAQMREASPINSPKEIRVIDPCMGSGHVLVYAFDVLFQIYVEAGFHEREIPNLILTHNLYGLDIDDRAGQLAYFALMMKARSANRRFFRQENVPQPMVHSADGDPELSEYGSLVKVEELGEEPAPPEELHIDSMDEIITHEREVLGWNYRRLLAQKYDVVVTNPPYMGGRNMTTSMFEYLTSEYPNSKSDLYAVFIERCGGMLTPHGLYAMVTQHSWMFLSSYEKLRQNFISNRMIISMAHLGARAFDEISGEVVQTTAFVMSSTPVNEYIATYHRLVHYIGQKEKEVAFFNKANIFMSGQNAFLNIPGMTYAYWILQESVKIFSKGVLLEKEANPRQGLKTLNNEYYIRNWHEVDIGNTFLHSCSLEKAKASQKKWFPINHGGEFRKYYGNNFELVNWFNDGEEMKKQAVDTYNSVTRTITNINYYFKEGLTWSVITNTPSFRRYYHGHIFSNSGQSIVPDDPSWLDYLSGLLNSKITSFVLSILSPALGFESGYMKKIPVIKDANKKDMVERIARECIDLSRADWDSFETSWDFTRHPLLNGEKSIEAAFAKWQTECNHRFTTLKSNEEELNRIFIDIYGLQDELTPEVEDKDVTVRKADLNRDIRSFISYAVGCMFGRYSLDEPGLVFAGGKFDPAKYTTFKPNKDNIIPINHIDYFDSDILLRFTEFVRTVYGENTLHENLDFIANTLYPNASGTTPERLRRYFLTDFYKDHVKTYQKRPIYWLLDSGKKDGFKALIYLHRYDKYTIALARADYMHPLQRKYDGEIKRIEQLITESTDNRQNAAWRKDIAMLQAKMDECRTYDQVISHLAHQQIPLDLDDGIKVNYSKFQGVEVPVGDNKVEKMDLLGKI